MVTLTLCSWDLVKKNVTCRAYHCMPSKVQVIQNHSRMRNAIVIVIFYSLYAQVPRNFLYVCYVK